VLTCPAVECLSPVYMPTWPLGESLGHVHVMAWPSEERLSPVGAQLAAVRILLTSPCCRKGLRATGVMAHAGHHHYPSSG
jgi:hypothetical protein